ncbi:MAG TPA: hypothetical protein VIX40_13075 [Methylomirabilota bacterium]
MTMLDLGRPRRLAHTAQWLSVSVLATLLAGCAAYLPKPATPLPEVASEPGPSGWETPPLVSATRILPAPLLTGVHHALEDLVVNDGASHLFVISSEFGSFEAAGLAKLRIRLNEIRGIATIREARATAVYAEAARQEALQPLAGLKHHATQPVDALKGIGGGIMEYLSIPSPALRGEWTSSRDDDMPEALIGFADQKRVIAYDLHVDPYSTNPVLQEELNSLAWVAFAGQAGSALVPPGRRAQIAPDPPLWTSRLDEQVRNASPGDLREKNRMQLEAFGADARDIHEFFLNPYYSVTQNTRITAALEDMAGVPDRGPFVAVAADAESEELALFYEQVAEMMRAYYMAFGGVQRLVPFPRMAGLLTQDDELIVMLPVDHVFWTAATAGALYAMTMHARLGAPGAAPILWLSGRISPLARAEVEALGWTVQEEVRDRLGPGLR